MITLIHYPLSVPSRLVRLVLAECEIVPQLQEEAAWERRPEFLIVNPAGTLPVLVEDDAPPVCGIWAVSEYLDETRGFALGDRRLLPSSAAQRAEVRRLTEWFSMRFDDEVTGYLVEEKVTKRERARRGGNGSPDSSALRAARSNIRTHLAYIEHLLGARNWLAGERMSYADLAAAAALSVADYLGEVPWSEAEEAKNWYMRMKSRPGFRPLLADQIRTVRPPEHYALLDF
ncbi:glutathione S-transferase family protein [Propylenella binzhouense]|uniref:Glutathione S-transferase family protein n=1 Tax=Propylenella binzhouense TaxID=2555902 RepID=A0A964T7D8_9HYPH|nr:glutathione S-transferase family protein [Propylenella binzhouense]MYZ49883.1 glutathione S-transferase family protein [Propylenella binzhouense]